jgi:uncharacterized protein
MYEAALNALGLVVFVPLFAITVRRGTIDPMCGAVDRSKALIAFNNGETLYFCSSHCRDEFRTGSSPAPEASATEALDER